MDTPIEYLFDGNLRWSFGFENPNKAAVIFVCLLPLLWTLWDGAWRKQKPGLAVVAGLIALTIFTALCLTFSRGGLVAAAASFTYIFVRQRHSLAVLPRSRWVGSGILAAAALAILVVTGLGSRSAAPLIGAGDASVNNRFTVWSSALAMAADRPLGFGLGNSGQAYMDWYQPLGMSAGYRTLVSGYLTPLVEWGWPAFALAALAITLWWTWADPASRPELPPPATATGLRASLVGFAVTAVFSTVTEEAVLWLLPAAAMVILSIWTIRESARRPRAAYLTRLCASTCALLALAGAGWLLSASDPLSRQFHPSGAISLTPRDTAEPRIGIVPDPAVLGPTPGPLLREWALGGHQPIDIASINQLPYPVGRVILCGDSIDRAADSANHELILLCPPAITKASARNLLTEPKIVRIYISEIDEDRRSAFWQATAPSLISEIPGVGTRIDWAWSALWPQLSAKALATTSLAPDP